MTGCTMWATNGVTIMIRVTQWGLPNWGHSTGVTQWGQAVQVANIYTDLHVKLPMLPACL